jgi:cobalamin biosynthesis Mg chelatase CobN
MYYLICPKCKKKSECENDTAGLQYQCNACSDIFIVEEVYYDTPTQSVPTQAAIKKQAQTSNNEPPPTLDVNALPAAAKKVNRKKKSSASKSKKKRNEANIRVGNAKKSKSLPQKSSGRKAPRRKSRVHVAKKQSSPFPVHLIIIIVLCVVAVAVFIGKTSSRKKITHTTKSKLIQNKKSSEAEDNIFLSMLNKKKKK